KHNIENWECEQVFFNRPLFFFVYPKHSVSENRWAAFGKTDTDRFLVIVFTKRNNLIRIISARDMNKRERKFYDE
ncbi:MAG: BrnT family toxin, partial [Deltaproteobacteria bacterium]|nr:BrnT family toxin [Deltaproteobacteria bacterium]